MKMKWRVDFQLITKSHFLVFKKKLKKLNAIWVNPAFWCLFCLSLDIKS